jgi:hypothetical protein
MTVDSLVSVKMRMSFVSMFNAVSTCASLYDIPSPLVIRGFLQVPDLFSGFWCDLVVVLAEVHCDAGMF